MSKGEYEREIEIKEREIREIDGEIEREIVGQNDYNLTSRHKI